MKSPLTYLSFFLFFLVLSCAKPLISNLQKGTYRYGSAREDVLGVSVGLMPIVKAKEEPEKAKTFFDLRDSLAHVYLRLLSAKESDPNKFIDLLKKDLSVVKPESPSQKPVDYTTYKVLLNFSHWNKFYNSESYMHPNTRLEYLTTYLNFDPNSRISFQTIDRLENEFDEIDLGALSRDQTVTFNAKISGEIGTGSSVSGSTSGKTTSTSGGNSTSKANVYDGDGNVLGTLDNSSNVGKAQEGNTSKTVTGTANAKANGEIGYLNNETIKESVAVKLKRLRTGFSFSNRELVIAQRGRPLGDIASNTFVTVTLKVSDPSTVFSLFVYDFNSLFDSVGIAASASRLRINRRLVNFVPCASAGDIKLATQFEGAIRAVNNESGDPGENALEFDDKVTFYKVDRKAGDSVVINKAIYCKKAYKIQAENAAGKMFVLKIASPVPEELDIFVDDKPEVFLQWILEHHFLPAVSRLKDANYSLYFESPADGERVWVVKNNISDTELAAFSRLRNIKLVERNP